MSILSFISGIFKPAADIVDELHTSDEELGNIEIKKSELRNKLAEIEAKVSTRLLELQSQVIEANSKVAIAEQQHGNTLSKSWRPITSIGMLLLLFCMALDFIQYRELIVQIAGGFLGIYGIGRSVEKRSK